MAEPSSSPRASALLWWALFAPGLACAAVGVLVVESTAVVVLGVALLLVPLAVQLLAADWSREHIPEGHHHDHDHQHAPPTAE